MEKVGFFERLRYQFDNLMSKGTVVLLIALAGVTAGVITLISFIAWVTKASPDTGFLQLMWMGLMRSLDAGTMGGDTGSALFLILMFLITLCGILILSILIGILTTGIESKLDSLKKGRSRVIEKNHTIILGWSEQIFSILQELIEANSNNRRACVIIMGDKDKSEMDEAIRERISDFRTTRVVTRQGNPIDVDDLKIVSLNTSKSIIILPEDDISVIKTILAITNNPNKRSSPYHIVTVLKDPENIQVAEIAGNNQVEIILSETLIPRIIAQTCRQPGLSTVYTELLDFGGDEIYFSDCPEVVGKKFSEALLMFEKSTVIGVCSGGRTMLNPPMDTVFQKGDRVIAISEDDDTVVADAPNAVFDEAAIVKSYDFAPPAPEKTLILGWNRNVHSIIGEIDNYVADSSMVTVVSDHVAKNDFHEKLEALRHQKAELIQEDPRNRAVLESLLAKNYNHVIILCNSDAEDIQEADAGTLVILLHLRDISEKTGCRFSVVSEMLDFRNKKLAEVTKVNDFIVSEKLISLLLTQVSENKLINAVFQDLFDADGSEIYVKSAANYVVTNKPVSFRTVAEAARRKNEVAIGYIVSSEQADAAKSYGIRVNPKKSELVTLTPGDSIIVIAED